MSMWTWASGGVVAAQVSRVYAGATQVTRKQHRTPAAYARQLARARAAYRAGAETRKAMTAKGWRWNYAMGCWVRR